VRLKLVRVDGPGKPTAKLPDLRMCAVTGEERGPRRGDFGIIQHRTADERLVVEFFGYSTSREQWIHLGGVVLDRSRARAGWVTLAAMKAACRDASADVRTRAAAALGVIEDPQGGLKPKAVGPQDSH